MDRKEDEFMKRLITLLILTGLMLTMPTGCITVSLNGKDDVSDQTSVAGQPSSTSQPASVEQSSSTGQPLSSDQPSPGGFSLNDTNDSNDGIGQFGSQAGNVSGTGAVIHKEYPVDNFNSIILNGGVNIVYKSGGSGKVLIDAQENLFPYIRVSSDDQTLTLDFTDRIWKYNATPLVTVYTPDLSSLTVNGAAKFEQSDTIKGQKFTVNVYGACSGDINLDVDSLQAVLAGAGTTTYHGKASSVKVEIAGAGNMDALDLATKDADITISGVGSGSISCSDNLSVTISGLGNLNYKGDPVVQRVISGLGKVNKINVS